MIVKKIENIYLAAIAEVHKKAYQSDHFSSHFTKAMLIKFYAELISLNPYCYFALSDDNQIAGFIIGGEKTNAAVKQFVKKNIFSVFLTTLANPQFWISRFINFFKMFGKPKAHASVAKLRLLSIAVNPDFQKKGAGQALLNEFEKSLLNDGIKLYGLSVHADNLNALAFYDKNGFVMEQKIDDGLYYLKNL